MAPRPSPPPAAGGRGAPHAAPPSKGIAGHWIQQGGQPQLIHAVGPGHWAPGPKPGYSAPPKPKMPGGGGGISSPTQPPDPAVGGHYTKLASGQWQLVHATGRNKWAPGPPAQNPSNWLQPLTNQQVNQQAQKTVAAAYQPALGQLDNQSSQEQAIYDKQQSDNQYYMQWMDAKSNSLNVQQQQVNQQTQALEQQLTGNATTTMGAQSADLVNAANARAGNVSNNAQANQFGAELTGSQQQSSALENAAATDTLQQERSAQGNFGAAQANAGAYIQSGALREQGDFQKTMQAIANTKSTDLGKEASDLQREVARLQGVQINVMENNRNYNAAAQKLGITVANTQSEINTRAAQTQQGALRTAADLQNAATSQARLKLDLNKAQQSQMNSDRNYQLAQAKFGASTAKDIYERQHNLGPYKPGSNAAKSPLTQTEQNTVYNHIDKVQGNLQRFIGQFQSWGATPQAAATQAWHALNTGRYYGKYFDQASKTYKWGWRVVSGSMVETDTGLLNAAFNSRPGAKGLTKGDIAYLTGKLHLDNPESRLG